MKVLVNTPKLSLPGGVANYYATILPYLPGRIRYFETGCRGVGESRFLAVLRGLADYWKFSIQIGRDGYDLIHLNPSLGPKAVIRDGMFLLIASVLKKPTLIFFRGWDRNFERFLLKHFRWLFRWVYLRSDGIVVLAEEFKRTLRLLGYSKPIFVETTVVDDGMFAEDGIQGREAQTDAPVNLLFLARIEKGKGIYELLSAFRQLRERNANLRLTVAGDGPERLPAEAHARAQQMRDVTFPGFLTGEAKHRAFQNADIYILASHDEGMPNSVLEAMAFGLPVVTTPVGGLKDFFEDGRMGFLVEDLRPEAIAEKIQLLLDDPDLRRRMGEYNREYARRRFAASAVAGRLLKIYEQVLADA